MASSKLPLDVFDVPQSIINLALSYEVHYNLRPDKRSDLKAIAQNKEGPEFIKLQIKLGMDGIWSEPIHPYLESIKKPTRVAMLIQGSLPEKLCTVVTIIQSVYWTDKELFPYPRIDLLNRPKALDGIISNVWGGYVIAIAPVQPTTQLSGELVTDEKLFLKIVEKHGVKVGTAEIKSTFGILGKIPEFLNHPELIQNL